MPALVYRSVVDQVGPRPFEVYDTNTNAWSARNPVSNTGEMAVGQNGSLYMVNQSTGNLQVYNPVADTWSNVMATPFAGKQFGELQVSTAGQFFYWTEGYGGGDNHLYFNTAPGVWSNITTPSTLSAGDYDPVTNSLYIAQDSASVMYKVDATTKAITTFSVGASLNPSEQRRFGEVLSGKWYSGGTNATPTFSYDVSNPATPLTQYTLSPSFAWPAAAADSVDGVIFLNSYASSTFAKWNPATNTVTSLAPGVASLFSHTTLAVVPAAAGTVSAVLDGSGNLTITDIDPTGKNNAIHISRDGSGNLVIAEANEQIAAGIGTLSNSNKTLTISQSLVTGHLILNTGNGNDVVTIDYGGVGGFFTTPIDYHGGNNSGDTLIVQGGSFNKATETFTAAGPGHSGSLVYDTTGGGVTTDTITYDGLAPVDMTGSTIANLVFNLPAGGTSASLEDDGFANSISQLRNTAGVAFETTTFSNPSGSLTINRGSAADTLTTAALPDFSAALTVGSLDNNFNLLTVNSALSLSGAFNAFAATANLNANITATSIAGAVTTVNVDDAPSGQIQDGVDVAASGGTVHVAAGNYPEFVTIAKSLTLSGAQAGVDARTGRNVIANESVIDGSGQLGIIWIVGDGLTVAVDGFTLQSDNAISVFNNGFGAAITTVQSANFTGMTVVNNVIQHASIGISPQGDLALIQHNLIRDMDIDGPAAGTGIYTDFGLTNSTIDGNTFVNNPNESIDINTSGGNNVLSNNVMDSGIYLHAQSGSQVLSNTITNSFGAGITLGGGQSGITVTNNDVNGVAAGYSAFRLRDDGSGPNSAVTVGNNKFVAGADGYGVRPGDGSYSGTLTLTNNQISGGLAALQNDDAALPVDASFNFWSTSNAPGIAVSGAGSTNVDFTPLLDNGDAAPLTQGFQPNYSSLTVHALDAQTGVTGRITEAYNALTATGTINVLGGSYVDTLDFSAGGNKAVTLTGGVSPAQVVLAGSFTLNANDVLSVEVTSAAPATGFFNWAVTGAVTLGGATLVTPLSGSYVPGPTDAFTLIDNDGTYLDDPVSGIFAGLPAGSIVTLNGKNLKLFYQGNDGNDVVLLPEIPSTTYVDENTWGAPRTLGDFIPDADLGTAGFQSAVFGYNAFGTITDAINSLPPGLGSIILNSGTYAEAINLTGTRSLIVTGLNTPQAVTINSIDATVNTTISIQGSSTLTFGDATNTAIAGVINGAGSLTKTGAGTLTLSNTNTFSGSATIAAGLVIANSSSALGNGSATNTLIFNGGDLKAAGAIASPSTRGVTLSVTPTIDTNGNSVAIAGAIGGAGGLTKIGAGTLTFSGASPNSFAGAILIDDGTLLLSKTSGVAAIAGPGSVTIGDNTGTAASAVLQLNAGNQIGDAVNIALAGADAQFFSNLPLGDSETIAPLNQLNGIVNDFRGGDVKVGGAGTLVIAGDYVQGQTGDTPGTTTLAGGILKVGSSGGLTPATGGVNQYLLNTGTLRGFGSIVLSKLTNSATIDPGSASSTGTIAIQGNVDLTTNSVVNLNVNGAAHDSLAISLNPNIAAATPSTANPFTNGAVFFRGTLNTGTVGASSSNRVDYSNVMTFVYRLLNTDTPAAALPAGATVRQPSDFYTKNLNQAGGGDGVRYEPRFLNATGGFNALSQASSANGGLNIPTPSIGAAKSLSLTALTSLAAQVYTGVTVTRGGVTTNSNTRHQNQMVTLTNTSANPIVGPIYLELDVTTGANVRLFNKEGLTYTPVLNGKAYVVVSSADLAANASVSVQLEWANPDLAPFTYTATVWAGGLPTGVYSPGNSPGGASISSFVMAGGDVYNFEIANATGAPATVTGWDMATVEPNALNPTAQIAITATPANPYNIFLTTLLDDGVGHTAGLAANFNPALNYAWKFLDGSNPATTITGAFDPAAFKINAAAFQNAAPGTFSIELRDGGKNFYIVYTAPAPTVSGVAMFVGPTSGGNVVIITGTGFSAIDPVHAANAVTFGGVSALSYTVNSNSQITAVVPAGAAATVNVAVANAGGASATASTADDYTYAAPLVTSVVINGGASAAKNIYGGAIAIAGQRSVVEQIAVAFNERVRLDADSSGISQAFNISSLAGSLSASVAAPANANVSVIATPVASSGNATDGYTQYVLTFAAGAGVTRIDNGANGQLGNVFTLLKDGLYQLNTVGAHIHGGVSDTASDRTDSFWSLFGAVNSADISISPKAGENKLLVDGIALGEMYAAFGSFANASGVPYNSAYDSNLDGIVDGIDLGRMYANFGAIWTF